MRKRLFTQAYFLINYNQNYGHSFGIRLRYVGLNGLIGCYAVGRYYFNVLRLKSAEGEAAFQ